MPWDSVDKWRDEDEDDDFWLWQRTGIEETITPELRARIDEVKAARVDEPRGIEDRMTTAASKRALNTHEETELSEREVEVLTAVADGLKNQAIAQLLFVSEETVKSHVRHILAKLEARDRTHAVALAYQRRILTLPEQR